MIPIIVSLIDRRNIEMKKELAIPYFYFLLIAIAFCLITSCANTRGVIGKWREIGKISTIELRKDNTFRAVDNQGMSVSGKYNLYKDGKVDFEILRPGDSPDIVYGIITMRDDGLIMTFGEGKDVERYRKENKP